MSIWLLLAGLVLMVGYGVGWSKSNALTNEKKLAAWISVLCYAGFLFVCLDATVQMLLP